MRQFGFGLLAGFLALLGSLIAIGATIAEFAPNSMPAPAISPLIHLDEKLRFIRDRPELDPRILAVGSSVTWRQLAGQAFEGVAGGSGHILNGASAHLQIHQTRTMARFYLDHFPHVSALLVMVSLPDFSDCTNEPASMFSSEDAARYAFDDWPAAYFYLRYVSPIRYVRAAMTLAERRMPLTGDLHLDSYGSSPLQVPATEKRGLRYGAIDTDPACIAALDRLIADAEARGVLLTLVFTPIHPGYRARYAAELAWLAGVVKHTEAEVKRRKAGTIVLNMINDTSFGDRDFFDAFHLQWSAVNVLSSRIARSLEAVPLCVEEGRIAHEDEGQREAADSIGCPGAQTSGRCSPAC